MARRISKKLQDEVTKRDGGVCQECGKKGVIINRWDRITAVEPNGYTPTVGELYNGKGVIPFEVDHKIRVFDGGDDSLTNLRLLCRSCNRRQSQFSAKEFVCFNTSCKRRQSSMCK